jgi:hypothetical protein
MSSQVDPSLPLDAQAVLDTERENLPTEPTADDPRIRDFGLAISGGGIRSATFALGVLQVFARHRLIERLGYLSTVSGGGYIGSWLMGLLKRGQQDGRTLEDLQSELTPNPDRGKGFGQDGAWPEAPTVRWLRRYSNYLSPDLSLASADSWSIATIYFRNLLINLLPHLFFLVAVLMLPYLGLVLLSPHSILGGPWARWVGCAAAFSLAVVLSFIRVWMSTPAPAGSDRKTWWSRQGPLILIAVLLAVSAYLGTAALNVMRLGTDLPNLTMPSLIVATAAAILVLLPGVKLRSRSAGFWVRVVVAILAGGAAFYGLLHALASAFYRLPPGGAEPLLSILGAPAILLLYSLIVVLLIGFMGAEMPDFQREWWSRLGAWLLMLGTATAVLQVTSLFGPLLVIWLRHKSGLAMGALSAAWAAVLWKGVAMAWSSDTSGKPGGGKSWKEAVLAFLPVVAMLGFLLILATGAQKLLDHYAHKGDTSAAATSLWQPLPGEYEVCDPAKPCPPGTVNAAFPLFGALRDQYFQRLKTIHGGTSALKAFGADVGWGRAADLLFGTCLGLFLLGLAGWLLLDLAFDVNESSMNQFYRNRLVRCYLGASRWKGKDPAWENARRPFIDINMDGADDLPLTDLQGGAEARLPIPLVNAAVNLSQTDPGQQERRASSFVFTPFHCGYTAASKQCYQPLAAGLQLTLGQAFSISGAAASPNMGYHTSAPLAFLMTLFNVRLGWRLNNTNLEEWAPRGPKVGTLSALGDLFGLSGQSAKYVYLSDGGHFENLAVYELIRRQCRYIICIDAEQDEGFTFESLGGLLRKAREDFGAEITIDVSALAPQEKDGPCKAHWAIGHIRYKKPELRGVFVYIKASVTGDEPRDVLQYRAQNPAFPHQSTGDQFFSESQFESYRRLGIHAAASLFGDKEDGSLGEGPAELQPVLSRVG